MDPLKAVAKRLPHPLLFRAYLATEHRRMERVAEAARRRAGIAPLREADLGAWKRSPVVFLLGSGSSINRISGERWKAIADHDTIALNLWPLHPFVPRIYCFESMLESEAPYRTLRDAIEERQHDYRDTLKIVNDCYYEQPQIIDHLSPEWRQNLYCAHTIPAVARTTAELEYCVRYWERRDAFSATPHVSRLFKYGSNLIAGVTLALRMEYRQIVLCGVDLTDQAYFFHDPELFPRFSGLEFAPRSEPHPTTRRLPFLVPVDEVLLVLKHEIMEPRGIELSVESRTSALWPRLPEAPESLYEVAAAAPRSQA